MNIPIPVISSPIDENLKNKYYRYLKQSKKLLISNIIPSSTAVPTGNAPVVQPT